MMILPMSVPRERSTPIVRVSDLRQWTYCPRVVWWTHVCPVGKVESFKMKQGVAKERRLQRLQRRRTLHSFGLREGQIESNFSLYSPDLGLSGRLDLLIQRGASRFPVEVKFTRGPARLNHRLQLAGYALLLEAEFGVPVPHGYVVRLPGDTIDKVTMDSPLRELAWRTIQAVRMTLIHERMPMPVPQPSRCSDCEYLRFCGDIESRAPRS
jgi:CRISPR-associated exonuclease Cas4